MADMAAMSCCELTKVVGKKTPPKYTCMFAVKFVPLTVSVNAPLPACAEGGDRLVITWPKAEPARAAMMTRNGTIRRDIVRDHMVGRVSLSPPEQVDSSSGLYRSIPLRKAFATASDLECTCSFS